MVQKPTNLPLPAKLRFYVPNGECIMALSSEAPVGVLLTSAARTTTCYSDAQMNDAGYRGILIFFDATVEVATASVTPTIEAYNPGSNEWETYLTATAVSAVGETSWFIYPAGYDMTGTTGHTDEHVVPLPINWRLKMTASDTDSLTYSAGYNYIP